MIPVVSAHAIDRYLERFPGAEADRRSAEQAIAALVRNGVNLGAIGVFVRGCTFVLRGPAVITVLPGRRSPIVAQSAICRRRIDHRMCA